MNNSYFLCSALRLLTTASALLLSVFSAHPQAPVRRHINVFLGSQAVNCNKFIGTADLDFMNYLDAEGFSGLMGNYMYIGVMYQIEYKDKAEAKVMVSMHSDMAPVKLNFNSSYYFNRTLGFGASFFGYQQAISNFNLHHDNDVGFIIFNSNARGRNTYNLGLALGPDFRFRSSFITLDLKLHCGTRWQSDFSEAFHQKLMNSNYSRSIEYHTSTSPTFYFFPQVEIGIYLFKLGQTSLGIKGKVSREWASRSINYTKIVSEWGNTPYSRSVTFPGHKYTKLDYDVGLSFSW